MNPSTVRETAKLGACNLRVASLSMRSCNLNWCNISHSNQGCAPRHWLEEMTAFDISPQPTKRRKTGLHESSNLPITSRAFRAVKEVVFGSSPSRSSPKSRNRRGSAGQVTPTQSSKKPDGQNIEETVDWDVPDSDKEGRGSSAQTRTQTRAIKGKHVAQSNGTKSSSKQRRTEPQGKADLERDGVEVPNGDGPKILAPSVKIDKRQPTARSEVQDLDELGGNAADGEAVDTVRRTRSTVNRIGKPGRTEQQECAKAGDWNKLRNGTTIDGPGDRNSLPISANDANSEVNGHSAEELKIPKSGPATEKLSRESQMKSVEPEKVAEMARTPHTRSGRKRGLKEGTGMNETATDRTPATPSSRKRGRPRKQTATATILQDRQDDDLGFKEIPSRLGSIDPLLNRTNSDDYIAPSERISLPASVSITPGRARRRAAKETLDTSIAANTVPSEEVVGSDPESHIDDSVKGYVKELKDVLDKDTKSSLTTLKTQTMDGLTGKRRLPLMNLDEEYQKVHQLVEQTVLAGEGNSMLVVGSRGTAKTLLVETVIEELAIDHRENFHVVRLNGFIHTDDKLALREIWRQLGREMEVEDDVMGGRSNYADTLASLLALLSHSAENSEAEQEHIAKSVIFVIDEFDLFTSHPRQTLLYNLFDVAQSRNAPIAVLGLTTKLDVVESLEKRVKSRFSQRHVHLSLAKSYAAFKGICKSALACPHPAVSSRLNYEDSNFQNLCTAWKNYVDGLFIDDATFDAFLLKIYTRTKSIPSFLTACLLPVSLLSPTHIPTGLDFATQTLLPPDSKLHLLPGLSDLELSLLIAAARLDIILDTDMCSFSMAYDEYQQLASRVKAQSSAAGQTAVGGGARIWGREVASGAWERLTELELILPATGGNGRGEMGRANGRMWRVDVGLEEIGPSLSGMSGVMAKWCREI